MMFEVPILIQPWTEAKQGTPLYAVRPLFFAAPVAEDRDLRKATGRLEKELRDHLRVISRQGNHSLVASHGFSPHVSLNWLDVRMDLRQGLVRCRLPLATFAVDDRRIGFSPYFHDFWFEIESGLDIVERATNVFTRYLRDLEKRQDGDEVKRHLARFERAKRPWLSVLEFDVDTRIAFEKTTERPFALLGEASPMDGAEELRRLGQCLNDRYPDELTRAIQRDSLVQPLSELLATADNRPVLLVGASLTGKTTLVHEAVFREMERRGREQPPRRSKSGQIWHLAPQRIVSGMSYVGQWEDRWLAILRHVRKKRHTLYFDDLLGLFQAGITSESNLSAADVLKPYIERREFRLLAEMTPEQLRVFRERDRGFSDMFHVLPVEEPDEEATLRILLGTVRSLETRFGTRFDLEVLPTVLDLTRRYQPDVAFPGKAAVWLSQLAAKYPDKAVTRNDAIDAFRARSGLQLTFVDTRQRLLREDIVKALRSRIIGQQQAVETMADVVAIAKARLNDPHRPLGSLFFLGPTGVGKTECAKALAAYLFSDESRLLRFDMNEFVSPYAAARLAGTFDQPEGLLTGAVRRQPFCVLLFDEIEKAHPDVFDLLLQILGEARLTDALGRTADFSNAVVILTSNLGTRHAACELGFGPRDSSATESIYYKAMQEFFRPEFINRLDHIVPFSRLEREELAEIARIIIHDTIARQGLVRRKCAVDISPDALDWIMERGYDPTLGARAMRRAVERELVSPLARQLAAVLPETPTVLEVTRHGSALAVRVTPLEEAERQSELDRVPLGTAAEDCLAKARTALDRIVQACESRRPPGEITASNLSPELAWHLGIVELTKDVRLLLRELRERVSAPKTPLRGPAIASKPGRKRSGLDLKGRRILKELYAAEDVREYCRQLASELPPPSVVEDVKHSWWGIQDRLAFLDAVQPGPDGWRPERALLLVRSPNASPKDRRLFTGQLLWALSWSAGSIALDGQSDLGDDAVDFGLESEFWPPAPAGEDAIREQSTILPGERNDLDVVVLEGYFASRLAGLHEGTHLVTRGDGSLQVYQAIVVPLGADDSVEHVLGECLARDEMWRKAVAGGGTRVEPGPFAWRPVLWFMNDFERLHVDFRCNRQVATGWDHLSRLLPLPPEFQD